MSTLNSTPPTRPQLRRQLRNARRELSPCAQRLAARGLYRQLAQHPLFRRAKHLSLYLPTDGEIDPRLLLRAAQRRGKLDAAARLLRDKTLLALSKAGADRLRRRQRQRVQLDYRVCRLAQAVTATLEHMPQPIADGGTGIFGHGHVDGLQQQVALRRSGCQLDQRVATVAHDGDVLGRLGFGRGRDFLDGVGRDRRSRRRAATGQHRPQQAEKSRQQAAFGMVKPRWRGAHKLGVLKHRALTIAAKTRGSSKQCEPRCVRFTGSGLVEQKRP